MEIRSLQCVKLLINYGAKLEIKAHDSRTAFDFAIQVYGDEEIEMIKYIYDRVKNTSRDEESITYIHKLCLGKKNLSIKQVAEMLVEKEDVNASEGHGRYNVFIVSYIPDITLCKTTLCKSISVLYYFFYIFFTELL